MYSRKWVLSWVIYATICHVTRWNIRTLGCDDNWHRIQVTILYTMHSHNAKTWYHCNHQINIQYIRPYNQRQEPIRAATNNLNKKMSPNKLNITSSTTKLWPKIYTYSYDIVVSFYWFRKYTNILSNRLILISSKFSDRISHYCDVINGHARLNHTRPGYRQLHVVSFQDKRKEHFQKHAFDQYQNQKMEWYTGFLVL